MKFITLNLFFLVLLIFSCNTITGGKVPEAVIKTFQQKYPGEKDPSWAVDKNGYWEAKFKQNGKKLRADFHADGEWIETESNIKKGDLPKPIKEAIKEKYDDYKIVEIEMVTHHSKGIFYDVEFLILGKKVDVEFDSLGNKIN